MSTKRNFTISLYCVVVLLSMFVNSSFVSADSNAAGLDMHKLQNLHEVVHMDDRAEMPDDCQTNPCLNGGLCKRNGPSYGCFCPFGHTGSKCEKEMVSVCDSNPCLNGGSCILKNNTFSTYVCYCSGGYAGLRCERAIDICNPNPCLNNGICNRIHGSDYTCYCPPGYHGFNCENDGNYRCDFEQGFCDFFRNDFHNKVNWTLQQAKNVSELAEDHTYKSSQGHFAYVELRKGVAITWNRLYSPWMYSDHCFKLWYNANLGPEKNSPYGPASVFGISESGPKYTRTKLNVKFQTDGWKFFNFSVMWSKKEEAFRVYFQVIRWPVPFAGHVAIDDVEILKGNCSSPSTTDVCSPNPCQNGAFCEKKQGFSYVCYCPTGFTGLNCEKEADPCRSLPCYYGSTCQKVDGQNYICICPRNATGPRCEKGYFAIQVQVKMEELTGRIEMGTSEIAQRGSPAQLVWKTSVEDKSMNPARNYAPRDRALLTTKPQPEIASGANEVNVKN